MKTLGTKVTEDFADAIAYFASKQSLSSSAYIREAAREAASGTFKQKCELYETRQRLIRAMREGLREGHWKGLAGENFPETHDEWIAQIERYERECSKLLDELREMKPYADILEVAPDQATATAMTAIQTAAIA